MRENYGRHEFGQSALLARRLVEAGVRLVHVNWVRLDDGKGCQGYDTHRDHLAWCRDELFPPTDRAFGALVEDLQERGLLEETLVLLLGEFGRTPRFNKDAGRDHWPYCYSMVLAGGGIRGGMVSGLPTKLAPIRQPIRSARRISWRLFTIAWESTATRSSTIWKTGRIIWWTASRSMRAALNRCQSLANVAGLSRVPTATPNRKSGDFRESQKLRVDSFEFEPDGAAGLAARRNDSLSYQPALIAEKPPPRAGQHAERSWTTGGKSGRRGISLARAARTGETC